MLDHDAEKSASIEPDSLANAMMPACHCGTAMKRMATAPLRCARGIESSRIWERPRVGSD